MVQSDVAGHFSEESFAEKITDYARTVGKEAIRDALILYALVLYYTLHDPTGKVSSQAKGAILGALGYFIFPCDAIPDMIPVIGYVDDLAIITAVMSLIGTSIPAEAKQRARDKVRELFGSPIDTSKLAHEA